MLLHSLHGFWGFEPWFSCLQQELYTLSHCHFPSPQKNMEGQDHGEKCFREVDPHCQDLAFPSGHSWILSPQYPCAPYPLTVHGNVPLPSFLKRTGQKNHTISFINDAILPFKKPTTTQPNSEYFSCISKVCP